MNPSLFIYLSDVIGNLNIALVILMVLSCATILLSSISWCMGLDCRDENLINHSKKILKISFISFLSFLFISVPIPSEKTIYLIGASEVVQSVANNEKVGKIADKSIELLEKKIAEYTNEKLTSK